MLVRRHEEHDTFPDGSVGKRGQREHGPRQFRIGLHDEDRQPLVHHGIQGVGHNGEDGIFQPTNHLPDGRRGRRRGKHVVNVGIDQEARHDLLHGGRAHPNHHIHISKHN